MRLNLSKNLLDYLLQIKQRIKRLKKKVQLWVERIRTQNFIQTLSQNLEEIDQK